ncbi:MAG TPA: hypothetical protein PKH48_06970 [Methanofastidiosum sp.]|jgi:hypothetical protein|nr:hypothetical protein [Methanofastidiosum sp.]
MGNNIIYFGLVLIILGAIIAALTCGPAMYTQKTFEEFDNECRDLEDQLRAAYDIKASTEEETMQKSNEIDRLQDRLQECYYYRGEVAENMFIGPGIFYSGSILMIIIGTFFIIAGGIYSGLNSFYNKKNKSQIVRGQANQNNFSRIFDNSENSANINSKIAASQPNELCDEFIVEEEIGVVEEVLFDGTYMDEIKEDVFKLIFNNPNISKSEISAALGIDELDVIIIIKDLIDEGRILDTGERFILL